LWAAVCEHELEGVVAKPRSGRYVPGGRGWVKVKNKQYWRYELEREGASRSRRERKFVQSGRALQQSAHRRIVVGGQALRATKGSKGGKGGRNAQVCSLDVGAGGVQRRFGGASKRTDGARWACADAVLPIARL
jgi:hypothetical protein